MPLITMLQFHICCLDLLFLELWLILDRYLRILFSLKLLLVCNSIYSLTIKHWRAGWLSRERRKIFGDVLLALKSMMIPADSTSIIRVLMTKRRVRRSSLTRIGLIDIRLRHHRLIIWCPVITMLISLIGNAPIFAHSEIWIPIWLHEALLLIM